MASPCQRREVVHYIGRERLFETSRVEVKFDGLDVLRGEERDPVKVGVCMPFEPQTSNACSNRGAGGQGLFEFV